MTIYTTLVINYYTWTCDIYSHEDELDALKTAVNCANRYLQNAGVSNQSSSLYSKYLNFLTCAVGITINELNDALIEYTNIVSSLYTSDFYFIKVIKSDVMPSTNSGNNINYQPITTSSKTIPSNQWISVDSNAIVQGLIPSKSIKIIKCKTWSCGADLNENEEYCWKCGRKDPTK